MGLLDRFRKKRRDDAYSDTTSSSDAGYYAAGSAGSAAATSSAAATVAAVATEGAAVAATDLRTAVEYVEEWYASCVGSPEGMRGVADGTLPLPDWVDERMEIDNLEEI